MDNPAALAGRTYDRLPTCSVSRGAGCSVPSTAPPAAGLQALVLSNSPASMELWAAKQRNTALLTRGRSGTDRHEAAGTTDDPSNNRRDHGLLRRARPVAWCQSPDVVRTSSTGVRSHGLQHDERPNEFFCIGTLRNWSVVDRVKSITRQHCSVRAASTSNGTRPCSRSYTFGRSLVDI